ncbi:Peptidase family M28 [Candidatus Kryptobacter tengchongensis]|uniref:Peptidase family M28 n=2 Tax=Kryptobacter tengchongensis TaxID=1643429 RepID=A0A656D2S0_KRYT1|nr:M28 family peptidase [Candidatus Kryptobacter tengchongensis]CUS96522.1 Peptidase family M28 [Candidatus Kryptobacter tengchongensis]CUT00041.1 Peptidase family M28 [Candidatus Kryptobacter tengchongensis]CUU06949.1 Peptidase family M28 [Candidatus Kryptobacter tengchongensis]
MHRALLLILLIFILSCNSQKEEQNSKPEPKGDVNTVYIPDFNENSAFEYLKKQVSFGPRVPNSNAHEECKNFLINEISKYADAVNVQEFTHSYLGKNFKLSNIIASFNLKSGFRILLCAHWDSRPYADEEREASKRIQPVPGANDGASGVAVLLEIARILKDNPAPIGVDIVFFDGEDLGIAGDLDNFCIGSKYFAKNKPVNYLPQFGILLDMVGDKELQIFKESNSVKYAPDVVNYVWGIARELGISEFRDEIKYNVYDDHIPLNEAGIRTIDIIDFDYPYWHTTEDTPDKCSPQSLGKVGKVLLNVIYRYKSKAKEPA